MADVWVKLCGCAEWADVDASIEAGADAFGMIFAPSARRIDWASAVEIAGRVPPSIVPVAVFVDPAQREVDAVRALFPRALLQFSGGEAPEFVAPFGGRAIKAVHVDTQAGDLTERAARFPDALLLFDSRRDDLAGGTGAQFDWTQAAPLARSRRVIIAGGLTPGTVAACVEATRPFGVDVRSGVETDGRKDRHKMRAFVRAAKAAA